MQYACVAWLWGSTNRFGIAIVRPMRSALVLKSVKPKREYDTLIVMDQIGNF